MSWRPDQQTSEAIRNMVDALFAVAPDVLGIDEFITGCTVTDMDVYGVGVGVLPRFIQAEIREYNQPVLYRGGLPTLALGDDVSVIHLRDGNRYEVAGPSGGSGVLPSPGLPCMVSVWRDCTLTQYADPDDAFTAATVAGDVILVPEGTWTLSAAHVMSNQTSIAGIGAHPELCVLQALASVGVDLITTGNSCFVFNVKISYVSAAAAARTALHITSTSEALLVDAYCQETGGEPWGIDVDGGRAESCTAYAVDQTTGKPIGIEVESGGSIFRCEGRALHATVGEAVGINLSIGSNSARWCRGEGQDIAGTSYGISSDTGTNIIEWCEADGETTDIYVLSGTLSLFSCQYASTAGAGTIAYLPGDHQVMDLDADTYIRALATDDQVDVVVGGTPAATWTAARIVLNEGFAFDIAIELTIAAGVITRTQVYHTVDTQGDAPTDNLDTINGGIVADILVIRPENAARTIVVRHNVGNIWLIGEADISLEDTEDHLHLIYDGSTWCSLGDGVGGAAGAHNLLSATHPDTDPQAVTRGSIIYGDATPDWTELVIGAANRVLTVNAGGTEPEWAVSLTGLYESYYQARDQKAQNTNGGTFTLGAWRTRDLTNEIDPDGIGAIAGNQITLDAGTYWCIISCPAFDVDRHKTRLQNVTGAATLLNGTTELCGETQVTATRSFVSGRFTVAGSQALEIQHYCQTTQANSGFGLASNFAAEIYTVADFMKEA